MGFFDWLRSKPNSKSRRTRRSRRVTPESLKLRREQMAIQQLEKHWEELDPVTRVQIATQVLGIKLVPAKEKTLEQRINDKLAQNEEYMASMVQARIRENNARFENASLDLAAKIDKMALDRIEKNPAYADKVMDKRVKDLLDSAGGGGPFAGILEAKRVIQQLKEEFGGKGNHGFWEDVLSRALAVAIPLLIPLLTKGQLALPRGTGQQAAPPPARDRGRPQVPPSDGGSVAGGDGPQPAAAAVEDVDQPPPGELQLTPWGPYLDKEPQDFVYYLIEQAQLGDQSAVFAISMLVRYQDADSFIGMLEPLRQQMSDDAVAVLDRLNEKEGRDWLQSAMDLLKDQVRDVLGGK